MATIRMIKVYMKGSTGIRDIFQKLNQYNLLMV